MLICFIYVELVSCMYFGHLWNACQGGLHWHSNLMGLRLVSYCLWKISVSLFVYIGKSRLAFGIWAPTSSDLHHACIFIEVLSTMVLYSQPVNHWTHVASHNFFADEIWNPIIMSCIKQVDQIDLVTIFKDCYRSNSLQWGFNLSRINIYLYIGR